MEAERSMEKRDEMCRRRGTIRGCEALQGRREGTGFCTNALGRSGVIMLHYI